MTHAELVQAATSLLSEIETSEQWLERYDAALSSANDQELRSVVYQLTGALHIAIPMAA